MYARIEEPEGYRPSLSKERLKNALDFLKSLERKHAHFLPSKGLNLPEKQALLEILKSLRGYINTVTEQNAAIAILNIRKRIDETLSRRELGSLKKELFHILGEPTPPPALKPSRIPLVEMKTPEKKIPPTEDRFLKKRLLTLANLEDTENFSKVEKIRLRRIQKSIEEINPKNTEEKIKEIQYYIETYGAETKTPSFRELLNRLRSELNLPTQQIEQSPRIIRLEPPRAQEPKDERISFLPEGMAPLPPVPLEEVETPSFLEKDLTPAEGTNIPASAFIRAREEAEGITGELKKIERAAQTVIEPPAPVSQKESPPSHQSPQKPFEPLTRPGDITNRYKQQQKTEEDTLPLEVAPPAEPSSSAEDPFGSFEISAEDERAADEKREKLGIKILERNLSRDKHYKYIGRIDENGKEHSLFGEVTITKLIQGEEGAAANFEYKIKGNFEHGKLVGNASVIYPASKKENGKKIIREIVAEGSVDENFLPHGRCVATNMADSLSFEGTFDHGVPVFGRTIRLVYTQDAQTGSDTYEKQDIKTDDHYVDAFLNPVSEHEGATEEVRRPVTQKIEPFQYEVGRQLSSSSPTTEDEEDWAEPLTMVGHTDDLLAEEPNVADTSQEMPVAVVAPPEAEPEPPAEAPSDSAEIITGEYELQPDDVDKQPPKFGAEADEPQFDLFVDTARELLPRNHELHQQEIQMVNDFATLLANNRENPRKFLSSIGDFLHDILNYFDKVGKNRFSQEFRNFFKSMLNEYMRLKKVRRATEKFYFGQSGVPSVTASFEQENFQTDTKALLNVVEKRYPNTAPFLYDRFRVLFSSYKTGHEEEEKKAKDLQSILSIIALSENEANLRKTISSYLRSQNRNENAVATFVNDVVALLAAHRPAPVVETAPEPPPPPEPPPTPERAPETSPEVNRVRAQIRDLLAGTLAQSREHREERLSAGEIDALATLGKGLRGDYPNLPEFLTRVEQLVNHLQVPEARLRTENFTHCLRGLYRIIDDNTPLTKERIKNLLRTAKDAPINSELDYSEKEVLIEQGIRGFNSELILEQNLPDHLFDYVSELKDGIYDRKNLTLLRPATASMGQIMERLERYAYRDVLSTDLSQKENYERLWRSVVDILDRAILAQCEDREKMYLKKLWEDTKNKPSVNTLTYSLQELGARMSNIKGSLGLATFKGELEHITEILRQNNTDSPLKDYQEFLRREYATEWEKMSVPERVIIQKVLEYHYAGKSRDTKSVPPGAIPDHTKGEPTAEFLKILQLIDTHLLNGFLKKERGRRAKEAQTTLRRKVSSFIEKKIIPPEVAGNIEETLYRLVQTKSDLQKMTLVSKIADERSRLDRILERQNIFPAGVRWAFESKPPLIALLPKARAQERRRREIKQSHEANYWYALHILLQHADKLADSSGLPPSP